MHAPADLIPLSALQHYLYCPRRCALIHLEQIWTESMHTAEGRILHEKAHSGAAETRGSLKTVTGLALRSLSLGLTGQADVVEFQRDATSENLWHAYPVEYKRGRGKSIAADSVQLCAQALCLEEMLGAMAEANSNPRGSKSRHTAYATHIPEGALFYGKTRRRTVVVFDAALRETTRRAAASVHELFHAGRTPPPPSLEMVNAICPECSLREECLPLPLARQRSASHYLASLLEDA